jgi:DNA repair exonuclease SbcCD ATPase subunit
MILFKKIRFKNFLSTGDKFTEIELNKSDSTLIVGQNGSGKSTMLDAISFALFGKPHRNINKPQLVNSINEKGCLVEVEFGIGNTQYKVVRGIKPHKFEIVKDGTLLNQNSHNKEYQKILEQNILKLNHKSFHQVVVLGSSSFIPFMQLASHHRRDVIEDLLDIGVFSKMNSLLKEKNASLKEKLNQVYHSIEINETKTESQKKYIRDISKINHDAKKEKEELIQRYKDEKDQHFARIAELNDNISENSIGLQEENLDATNEFHALREANTEIQTKIKALVKESKFYESNQTCPTCEQTIEEQLKQEKLEQAKVAATEFQSSLVEIAEKSSKATERLDEVQRRQKLNGDWQVEIQSQQDLVAKCDREIQLAHSDLEQLSDDKSDLSKANDDYDTLMKEYHDLMDEKNNLSDQSSYNTVIAEMLKDTGIKTKIINQYLPVINSLVNQFLNTLDFYVHFDLDGAFKETIRSRHRDFFTYESFSEGEKQRIDLALLFTWRQVAKMKNSVATNLLVLDETFDSSLDEAGIENLMKIINTLDKGTNVFIISHKGDMLDGKFKSKIEFWKEKNFSKMKAA